jgi:hypothetical protein
MLECVTKNPTAYARRANQKTQQAQFNLTQKQKSPNPTPLLEILRIFASNRRSLKLNIVIGP